MTSTCANGGLPLSRFSRCGSEYAGENVSRDTIACWPMRFTEMARESGW
jgi:hypothetical protein